MRVTQNVYLLESTPYSHAYLITAEENVLIDTGLPARAQQILRELQSLGVAPETVKTILLTHNDTDHVGNLARLRAATGAQAWSPAEAAPPTPPPAGLVGAFQSLIRARKPAVTGTYPPEQRFSEVQPIRAPGHTPEHMIFQYRNVLFTGDLLMEAKGKLRLLPGFLTWNAEALRGSIALLKQLDWEWLCPAHGEPMQHGPAVTEFLAGY
jgi:glyoxylase-like metal-dependent hydrolase (beta-lactamase superfamily II)